MPWPMVHFAVSEEVTSGKASPCLLLGSIAPDAIHARGEITGSIYSILGGPSLIFIRPLGRAC